MNMSPAFNNMMTIASTPEEAVKIFYAEASKAMAEVIANAIGKAVSTNLNTFTKSNSAIAGWENLIGGVHCGLTWTSPAVIKPAPLSQLCVFAPYPAAMNSEAKTAGVTWSAGVSVSGSF